MSRDIDRIVARAEEIFRSKRYCSEATAVALVEAVRGDASDEMVRIASVFGAGMGGSHEEACGVLTGGIIALGVLYGPMAFPDAHPKLRPQIQAMRERFLAHFRATRCDTIRLALPDTEDRCVSTVCEGTRLIAEYLVEERLL